MDRVLVVGDGAREHAIAWALSRSGVRIYAAMGHVNPGIALLAKRSGGFYRLGSVTDPKFVVGVAEEASPDLVVVGPEEPLFAGVADALRERGFLTLGAPARAAVVEQRKDVARHLQWKYKIPGKLVYHVTPDPKEAYLVAKDLASAAIKPVRQAGGKGVRVVYGEAKYLEDALWEIAARCAKSLEEHYIQAKYPDARLGPYEEWEAEECLKCLDILWRWTDGLR